MMKPTDTDTDHDLYDGLPPLSPEEEAAMKEEIDFVLAGKPVPASLLPILRERMEHALRTHPYPRQLVKAFAARKPTVVSGEGALDGSVESDRKAGKEGA
jgi:hypothetical protein